LRPKECVLAGGSGTHSVCVCTIHQNMKLMFQGAKLERMCEGYSYHDRLAQIQCNPLGVKCFLGLCEECPGVEKLQEALEAYFDEQMIDQVEYKQWTTTDRSTLETKVQSVDEFLSLSCCTAQSSPPRLHCPTASKVSRGKQGLTYTRGVSCSLGFC
jgi:hypothetical protein